MNSRQENKSPNISSVSLRHSADIMCYTHGLQALLDVLPENTDQYSKDTIDNYLWVIELLLSSINELLEDHPIKE